MSPHGPEKMGEFNIEQYGEKIPEASFEVAKQYDQLAEKITEGSYGTDNHKEELNEFAQYLKPNMKVLDLGCGIGQDSKFLQEIGMDVVGLDISAKMIEEAQKRNPAIRFIVKDFLGSDFKDNEFDAVWCSGAFNHFPSKWNNIFMAKVKKILKPNGILYISANITDRSKESWVNTELELKSQKVKIRMFNKALTFERIWLMLERDGFEILKQEKDEEKNKLHVFAKDIEY